MGALRAARDAGTDSGLDEADTAIPELPPSHGEADGDFAAPATDAPASAPEADRIMPEAEFISSVIAGEEPALEQAPAVPMDPYMAAVDGLVQRVIGLNPADTQAEARDAVQQLRGMVVGAVALGLQTPLAQVFGRHGASGEQLLQTALSPTSSAALEASLGFKARTPMPPADASKLTADPTKPSEQPRPPGGGSGSGSGSVVGTLAKLIAAPITVPVAAGSLVWQRLSQRFGPRPAVPVNAEAFSVIRNEFDEACGRAVAKISHIRSGPMNPLLSEMVANPLKLDEQFNRMTTDSEGEYHDRAQRMKDALASPAVKQQYEELQRAFEDLQVRSRRLAQSGHELGIDAEEHIETRVKDIADAAHGLPALGKDGRLQQLKESMQNIVERIQEFLRGLFGRPGATPA